MTDQPLFAAPARLRRLQIEVTTGCNLRCAGCQRTLGLQAGTWRNAHMPASRFAAILANAPPADSVILQGIGEPTLHPDLAALIAKARSSGKFGLVSFNTNALFADLPAYAALRTAGLAHVSISVDSLDPAIAGALRAGTDVAALRAAIAGLVPLFEGAVTLSIVLSRRNLPELPDLLDTLHGLGGRIVEIQPLVSYAASIDPMTLDTADIAAAREVLAAARRRLPAMTLLPAAALTPNDTRCRRPFHAGYVTVDGFLTPCCLTNDPDLFGRTSLADLPFATAWASAGVQRFLGSYFDREPAICYGCAFNPSGSSARHPSAPPIGTSAGTPAGPPSAAIPSPTATPTDPRLQAMEAARSLLVANRVPEAEAAFRSLIGAPEREALQGIGLARFRGGDAAGALAVLTAAEALGGDARCRHNLATVLATIGRGAEAIALEERNLREAPDYVPPYFTLAQLRAQAGEAPRAAAVLARLVERALAGADDRVLDPAVAQLHPLAAAGEPVLQAATRLRIAGRSDQAASLLAARLAVAPDDLGAGLAHAMAQLTMIHADAAEIADRRARYGAALAALEVQAAAAPPALLAEAAAQVGEAKPFFLAYHGEDDRALQRRYGRLVTRMIRAADAASGTSAPASQIAPPPLDPAAGVLPTGDILPTPALRPTSEPEVGAIAGPSFKTALAATLGVPPGATPGTAPRVRVGFATAYFHLHSVSKLFGGWMRHLDPARFAVFGYHLGQAEDATTTFLAAACTRFHRGPRHDAGWIAAMRADALDVLIYPEIGMHPTAVRLATRRIAPLQCVAWGHPVTTGLPEIDVFLSSALMEPPDGAAHYGERLVPLPGLSVCYTPQPAGTGRLDRNAFGIPPEDVAYLCCQSPFKYHPGDDAVLAEIAAAVPNARFVFIGAPARDANAARLRTRLARTLAEAGRAPDRHLHFVPHVPAPEFQALLRAGDVYLDSLRWSGGNTTLEAVTAGLPIVTTPGPLMRGRHSAAILTAMGLADHVSPSREEYVARAIALADPAARSAARAAVTARADRVAEDLAPVRALEAFLLAETARLRPVPEREPGPVPGREPEPASQWDHGPVLERARGPAHDREPEPAPDREPEPAAV